MDQNTTSADIFDRSFGKASRPPTYYNLDVIISVGYSVSVPEIMKSINVFHRVFYPNQESASKAMVYTITACYGIVSLCEWKDNYQGSQNGKKPA
jgi:hypothetical protein